MGWGRTCYFAALPRRRIGSIPSAANDGFKAFETNLVFNSIYTSIK